MKIVVLRHTQNCPKKGLTKKGRLQAKKATRHLKKIGIAHAYCSPAPRAIKTARFAKPLNTRLTKCISIANIGFDSERAPELIANIQARGSNWQSLWIDGWSGFETCENFETRVRQALESIKKENLNSVALIIAHEETVWVLGKIVNGVPFNEAVKMKIPYASLHIFEI